ncbi:MAG TPA: SDR family oxidoreductase [Ilumatobacteraceae bacterium]|nr:SDR family oxidoreductase [Ilumatobacteraceae bacterium]
MTTVVITGANRGLGLALAQQYVQRGWHVIAGCRKPADAAELADAGAEVVELDVGADDSLVAFAERIGQRPVDVLINNAGIDARALGADDAARGALVITPEQFLGVMNINVVGPLRLVQLLADNLRAAHGKVANISSQVGSFEVAKRIGRDAAYSTSKAALNMVSLKQSQAFREEGVTVLAFHPGWVRTDMGGQGADVDPADAAAGVARVIDSATIDDTGKFFRWDGSVHPW